MRIKILSIYFINSLLKAIATFLSFYILTKYLGTKEYGYYALILAIFYIFQLHEPIIHFFLTSKINTFNNSIEIDDKTSLTSSLIIQTLFSFIICATILLLWIIKTKFNLFENLIISSLAISIIILSTFLTSFSNTMHYVLSLKRNTYVHIWSDITSVIIQFLTSFITVLILGKNDNILLIGWLFYNISRFAILFIHFIFFYFEKNINLKNDLIEILRNYFLFFKNGIHQSYTFIVRSIITKSFGLEALGVFWHSQQYFNLFKLFQKSIIDTIWPDYLNKEKENAINDYNRLIISFLNLTLMFGALFFFYFGEIIIGIISNSKFNNAAQYVPMWLLVVSLVMTGNENRATMQITKKSGVITFIDFISVILSVLICIMTINYIGLYAVILSFMTYHIFLRIGNKVYLNRIYKINIGSIQFVYLSFFITINYFFKNYYHYNFYTFLFNIFLILFFIVINFKSIITFFFLKFKK